MGPKILIAERHDSVNMGEHKLQLEHLAQELSRSLGVGLQEDSAPQYVVKRAGRNQNYFLDHWVRQTQGSTTEVVEVTHGEEWWMAHFHTSANGTMLCGLRYGIRRENIECYKKKLLAQCQAGKAPSSTLALYLMKEFAAETDPDYRQLAQLVLEDKNSKSESAFAEITNLIKAELQSLPDVLKAFYD